MKKALQTSAIIFLALMLLMATGGFSIYHHICYCANKESSSFFNEVSCQLEKAAVQKAECCHKEVPVCCKDKVPVKHDKSCKKGKCCNTNSTFFKISDNYTATIGKISLKFMVSFIQVLNSNILLVEPKEVAARIPDFNDTSPPIYGIELLHQLHQLKIATS